jgi:hypothetical protein
MRKDGNKLGIIPSLPVPNWGAIINIPMEIVKRRASPNLEDAEEAIHANGWFLAS